MSVTKNLREVLLRIEESYRKVSPLGTRVPRLVAVSKEKPVSVILEAYDAGQRYFGENKILDLLNKSTSPEIVYNCPDIKWHFIGRIQSNKIKKLAVVRNLVLVETVDSLEHASALNSAWGSLHSEPLKVLIQVNTSHEPQKGGVDSKELPDLCASIESTCSHLEVAGLMCIGADGFDYGTQNNPDFLELVRCRDLLASTMNKQVEDLELSMGMSADFEHAIQLGSTNVRVGTTIFGSRI